MTLKTLPRQAGPALEAKQYQMIGLHNFRDLPQLAEHLSEEEQRAVEVVANVLPFKTNNYVVDELIDWHEVPNDPMFVLNFPQRDMLRPHHYDQVEAALEAGDKPALDKVVHEVRLALNPHPAGQLEHNVPEMEGERLPGIQHKYSQTALFFPSQGQTCHAYCSFCFRWPQFVGMDDHKFAMREVEALVDYLQEHPEVTDVLFTGGDPMVMSPKVLASYIDPLLDANIDTLKTIRIGSKSLSYWPYKFVNDHDTEDTLALMRRVTEAGKHLAFMAHFNHPAELRTEVARQAITNVRATGAEVRTQSPLLANINDSADAWAEMWERQVALGCVPYYLFVVRDTGAQHYFGVPLVKAWRLFREAYKQVSGLGRTVRGPSMSCHPGKVEVLGPTEVAGEKVLALRMLQGRNPDWVGRPFFAAYDEEAIWLDDLEPAFGEEEWFFSRELDELYSTDQSTAQVMAEGEVVSANGA